MNLQLDRAALDFLDEIRAFLDRHLPGRTRAPVRGALAVADREHWFAALRTRGWTVPHWPVEHGGTGWPLLHRYLWERECARMGAPLPDPVGTRSVGPALCRHGTAGQQRRLLPPIRELRTRWCTPPATEVAHPAVRVRARAASTRGESGDAAADTGHYRIDGGWERVPDAADADWLWCPAHDASGVASVWLVALDAPGVRRRPIRDLTGRVRAAAVILDDVRVTDADRLARAPCPAAGTQPAVLVPLAAQCAAQLARLRTIAATEPCGTGTLLQDAAFQRRIVEAELALAGLEGLEWRVVATAVAGQPPGPAHAVHALRGAELGQRLRDLQLDALGYHALAFPDPVLIDNEGPIGHDYGLTVIDDWLAGGAAVDAAADGGATHREWLSARLQHDGDR